MEVYLAPHPLMGLVLQVGYAEKFPQALACESLDPFIRVSKQGTRFTAIEKDEVTRYLYNLNLLAKLMVMLRHIPIHLAIAAIAEDFLIWISAEKVFSLHKVVPVVLKLVISSNFGHSC